MMSEGEANIHRGNLTCCQVLKLKRFIQPCTDPVTISANVSNNAALSQALDFWLIFNHMKSRITLYYLALSLEVTQKHYLRKKKKRLYSQCPRKHFMDVYVQEVTNSRMAMWDFCRNLKKVLKIIQQIPQNNAASHFRE